MAGDSNDRYNGGEYSASEFTPRERARIRRLVRDDDLAAGVRTTVMKWMAILGSIVTFVLLIKGYIRDVLKWAVSP